MGKYFKLFETHTQYEQYITGETAILPNVSHCINEAEVHYNPLIVADPRLIVTYNVTDASNSTQLYAYFQAPGITVNGAVMFDKVEIDGTEVSIDDLDTAQGAYQLSSGEHTVRYTLRDPTFIGVEFDEETGTPSKIGATFADCADIASVEIPNSVTSIGQNVFGGCSSLTSITIPNSLTSIGDGAFAECSGLTSIDIPSGVTSIGDSAFFSCTSLSSVIVKATTPPAMNISAFYNNAIGRKIYVPAESVAAYKAASGWSDYANYIEAIQ